MPRKHCDGDNIHSNKTKCVVVRGFQIISQCEAFCLKGVSRHQDCVSHLLARVAVHEPVEEVVKERLETCEHVYQTSFSRQASMISLFFSVFNIDVNANATAMI